ncbi:MAG TPA: ATP-binding protein [Anaeromyxobacter sp.]|nr:ATP-binding protein [Anaeromyxobacter sp.]
MDGRERYREVLAINRAIASAEEYDDILERVVEGTAAFTGASACLLLLSEGDGPARVVRSVGVDPEKAARLAVPLSERIDGELCDLLGFQARDKFVGVPVIGKEGLKGILAVYRDAPHVDAVHDDELISAFADQAAIALDEAERVRKLREARDREASHQRALLLAAVAEDLNKGVELGQVVGVAIRRGIEVLGREDGSLFLIEPDGRHVRGFSEVWEPGRKGAVIPLEHLPNTRRALASLRPRFFTIDEGGGVEPEWMARIGITGSLVVPLLLEERCVGFFYVNYTGPLRPSPDEVEFAQAIAAQCALAIGRARAYEAERSARAEAERTAKLQEQLMAVVGHDLRAPLSAITMAAAAMSKRGELPPAQATSLARIQSSAARMASIIRDLSDFSQARRGLGIAIQKGRVDLGDVCRRVLIEFDRGEGSARLPLITEGDLVVEADEGRIGQVVSNLVGNALQHGVGAPMQVRATGRGEEVVLTVRNEGPPIPPASLPHVFEPFWKGHGSDQGQSRRDGSIGLGLFIVREIVKAHDGTVEVRSEAGSGTTFTVILPRGAPVSSSSS